MAEDQESPTVAFPTLVIIRLVDLTPGDVLWGWERDRNYPRKGWLVEPEGEKVRKIEELDDRWVINNTHVLKGPLCPEYVLVEASSLKKPQAHLHILSRLESGEVTNNGRYSTPEAAASFLTGTPYREDAQLSAVLAGKVDRGYCVNRYSWVAVTRCSGSNQEECVELLTSVVIGGDIRLKKNLAG